MVATSALAQMTDMNAVENEVTADLSQVGISDIDVTMLTLKQLQEIKLVAASQSNEADKKMQIQAIVDREPGSQAD